MTEGPLNVCLGDYDLSMVKGLIIFWSILKEQYDKKIYYFLYKIIVLKKSSSPLPYHNQTKSPHTLPPATFPRRPDHILNFLKFYIFLLYIRFWIREQSYCSSSSHIICWPQKNETTDVGTRSRPCGLSSSFGLEALSKE